MSMRFLYTADWHLSRKHKYSVNNSRLKQIVSNMRRILDYAIKNKIDSVFVLGDVFDVWNPDNVLLSILTSWLRQCAMNMINVYVLVGNHDTNFEQTSLDAIASVLDVSTTKYIHVIKEPFANTFHRYSICAVPYSKDMRETVKEYSELGRNVYLFTHAAIEGATLSNGVVLPDKFDLSVADIKAFEKVFAGDYHKRQEKKNYVYSGSIIKTNFGERRDKKGFYDVSISQETGKIDAMNFVALPDIAMKRIAVKRSNVSSLIKKYNSKKMRGAVIQLKVADVVGCKWRTEIFQLEQVLYNCGAIEVATLYNGEKAARNIEIKDIELNTVGETCSQYVKNDSAIKDKQKYIDYIDGLNA